MIEQEFLTIATDHLRKHGFSLAQAPKVTRTTFPGRNNEERIEVAWPLEPATGMAALTQVEARPTLVFGLVDQKVWADRLELSVNYTHHSGGQNGAATVCYLDGAYIKPKRY